MLDGGGGGEGVAAAVLGGGGGGEGSALDCNRRLRRKDGVSADDECPDGSGARCPVAVPLSRQRFLLPRAAVSATGAGRRTTRSSAPIMGFCW